MKALLVEYGKVHHPQATREVRKTEVDNCFAEGLFGDRKQIALQRVTWWLFTLHFCFWPEIHPTSAVGRHFIRKTILNETMKSLCGKPREHPKTATASTSLLDDEYFIPLLKQLTMNAVRLNAKKYSKVIILQRWMNQNLHSTLPINTSKIQAIIFGTRSLP